MQPLVFFGSSPFSVVVLEKLLNFTGSLSAVVTTPDKPVGRHLKLTPNPVKVAAKKYGIPVFENNSPLRGALIGLVAAYGQIIPQSVLDKFSGRIYGIHPSLLPKYRGPSPLQQQILDGVTQTGVTIIQLDAQMDHGPILIQEKSQIYPNDTTASLGEKLFTHGAELFINFLLEPSTYHLKPQDPSQATYTQKLTRQDGFLPWEQFNKLVNHSTHNHHDPHSSLSRRFRALHPWPGVWTLTPAGKRLKLVSLALPLVQLEGGRPLPPPGFVKI